jgi:hypothetical protein
MASRPSLSAVMRFEAHGEGPAEFAQAGFEVGVLRDQRQQGLGQAHQVPLRDRGLAAEAVAPHLGVGGVRRPVRIVVVPASRRGRSRW